MPADAQQRVIARADALNADQVVAGRRQTRLRFEACGLQHPRWGVGHLPRLSPNNVAQLGRIGLGQLLISRDTGRRQDRCVSAGRSR